MRVEKKAPMKPSQVFLGDREINGVRPKKKPQMNAVMSLQTMIQHGSKNLHKHTSEG